METVDVFSSIKTIEFETPVDKIINQLKQLIKSGQLKPGDQLPAERMLAERFGVGRGYIREALMKLEFYGLIKTTPQSGTYVSGFGIKILDSIFSDIIQFHKDDFKSLMEGRYYLEINAVKLAAIRRNDNDIAEMTEILSDFDKKILAGENGVEDDMLFHIKIAQSTKNSLLESMLLILIPDLIRNINERHICTPEISQLSMKMHHCILDAIISKDADAAGDAMKSHLSSLLAS